MTLEDLAKLVKRMRDFQRSYFSYRDPQDLRSSKEHEKLVDQALKNILDPPKQPEMPAALTDEAAFALASEEAARPLDGKRLLDGDDPIVAAWVRMEKAGRLRLGYHHGWYVEAIVDHHPPPLTDAEMDEMIAQTSGVVRVLRMTALVAEVRRLRRSHGDQKCLDYNAFDAALDNRDAKIAAAESRAVTAERERDEAVAIANGCSKCSRRIEELRAPALAPESAVKEVERLRAVAALAEEALLFLPKLSEHESDEGAVRFRARLASALDAAKAKDG